MALVIFLCLLTLFAATAQSSTIVEKQPANDATSVYLYQQIIGRVEHLEKRDKDQQAEIDTLRSELYAEKQRTSILEKVIASLRSRDSETNDNDEGATGEDSNNRRNVKTTADPHSSKIVRGQVDVPVVAFHATLSKHQEHMGVHQSIAFDNVFTNIGGAYNPHVGTFVAPVQGVYVFYTKILGYNNDESTISIVRNGLFVANLYERDHEGLYDHDSAMVVLQLAKGDTVYVQNIDSDKFIHGNNYSMYSGFLLHENVQIERIVG